MWNIYNSKRIGSHSARSAWIETAFSAVAAVDMRVALRKECVD